MPVLQCPFPECETSTDNDDKDLAIALFNAHVATHAPRPATSSTGGGGNMAEKFQRPTACQGMLEEDWNSFLLQWEIYKEGANLSAANSVKQLIYCCEQELLKFVLRADPSVRSKTEAQVLAVMKTLAVVPVAMGMRRSELLNMNQDSGELARAFASRVQGKAATCSFTTKCTNTDCAVEVNFTDVIVKYVLVNGLCDDEIRRDALGWPDLDSSLLANTIGFIEQKEMARDALKPDNLSAVKTTYKKGAEDARLKKQVKCSGCDTMTPAYGMNRFGKISERKYCPTCWRKKTPKQNKGQKTTDQKSSDEVSTLFVGGISSAAGPSSSRAAPYHTYPPTCKHRKKLAVVLDHHIFDDFLGWTQKKSMPQPSLNLTISPCPSGYARLQIPCPKLRSVQVSTISDSGAQSCLWGLADFYKSGFKKRDLVAVRQKMVAANRQPLTIVGAMFITLAGTGEDGTKYESHEMVYVSPDAKGFYLSRQAMVSLAVIPPSFPKVGAVGEVGSIDTTQREDEESRHSHQDPSTLARELGRILPSSKPNHQDNAKQSELTDEEADPSPEPTQDPSSEPTRPCSCPTRASPPPRPSQLPFEA